MGCTADGIGEPISSFIWRRYLRCRGWVGSTQDMQEADPHSETPDSTSLCNANYVVEPGRSAHVVRRPQDNMDLETELS